MCTHHGMVHVSKKASSCTYGCVSIASSRYLGVWGGMGVEPCRWGGKTAYLGGLIDDVGQVFRLLLDKMGSGVRRRQGRALQRCVRVLPRGALVARCRPAALWLHIIHEWKEKTVRVSRKPPCGGQQSALKAVPIHISRPQTERKRHHAGESKGVEGFICRHKSRVLQDARANL